MTFKFKLMTALVMISTSIFAQKPVYLQSFEPAVQYSTTKGISGSALDLSANAAIRKILTVKNPLNESDSDFSVMLWVKASPQLASDYDVLSSTSLTDKKLKGWRLGVQANGAWRWEAMGRSRYEYNPTVERQTVKDNKWHLLAFSYSKEKEEVRLYYDGLNTAIYYCPGLDSIHTNELFIGGRIADPTNSSSAEYRDQWHAFNGALDQIALFSEVLSPDFIRKQYSAYFPSLNSKQLSNEKDVLKIMNFNIFHGGNETGKEVGVERIVEVIKSSGADVISMQETYGSGARIADRLGYYFYLRSTNISIMSRYPIEETLNGYKSFYNGGAHIRLSKDQKIAFFANWLNFPTDYWGDLEKKVKLNADILTKQMDEGNTGDLRHILQIIQPYIDQSSSTPVIFCGDFNSGSHLDWIASTQHLNGGLVVPFPSGLLLMKNGFKDSFREIHPDPLKVRGITWSPMSVDAFKDRIDYIYYKGPKIKAIASATIDQHPVKYPSDHAALLTTFKIQK
jgi:hypothetical protein